jgi:hypothetical protein
MPGFRYDRVHRDVRRLGGTSGCVEHDKVGAEIRKCVETVGQQRLRLTQQAEDDLQGRECTVYRRTG